MQKRKLGNGSRIVPFDPKPKSTRRMTDNVVIAADQAKPLLGLGIGGRRGDGTGHRGLL
jgi:hypothetical protein